MTIINKLDTVPDTSNSFDPNDWLDEYGDFLYRRALLILGKPEAAEDLVQDTLLAAFQSKEGFRGQSSVKTWLTTILKNKAIDYLRKAVRREIPTSFDENFDSESADFTSWGIWKDFKEKWGVWNFSAQDELENQGFADTLLKCIEKLPSNQRCVVRLKIFEDLKVEEVCKELELKPSNMGVLLFRARLSLRNCLETNWFNKI